MKPGEYDKFEDQIFQLIEIRGVYDGWSILELKDGTLINRWEPDDYRYAPTQNVLEGIKHARQSKDI